MSKLLEAYKHWQTTGKSGRANTDALLEAICEELLKRETPTKEVIVESQTSKKK